MKLPFKLSLSSLAVVLFLAAFCVWSLLEEGAKRTELASEIVASCQRTPDAATRVECVRQHARQAAPRR